MKLRIRTDDHVSVCFQSTRASQLARFLVKLKSILIPFVLFLGAITASAGSREVLERPLMFGPQYPLIFASTAFQPDTAFLLPEGAVFCHSAYTITNTWGFSDNATRNEYGISFDDSDTNGYSLYFDGEIERRFINIQYGISESIELQFNYREIRFIKGNLDKLVENFHDVIQIGAAGRDNAPRDQLEIYIYDNRRKELVTKITQPQDRFHQESMQLGIKFLVRETANEAISVSLASNFSDIFIEREINEVTDDSKSTDHEEFNDSNVTLRYSSEFESWTLHVAFSLAFVENSLLPSSPKEIYSFFASTNWHLSDSWDGLFQVLEYSSPFPKDNTSSLNEDVREIAAGLRWFPAKQFAWEIGFVENQSQGPQNIDVMFFSGVLFNF